VLQAKGTNTQSAAPSLPLIYLFPRHFFPLNFPLLLRYHWELLGLVFLFLFSGFHGNLGVLFCFALCFFEFVIRLVGNTSLVETISLGKQEEQAVGNTKGNGNGGKLFLGESANGQLWGVAPPFFRPLTSITDKKTTKKTRHWPHSFSFLSFLQPWIVFFLCLFVCFHFFSSSDILSQSLQLELFMGGVQVTISLLFFSRSGWRFVSLLDFSSVLRAGKLDDAAQDEQHTRLSD